MKFSALPCYFVPLTPKYSPQHPQPTFFLKCQRPSCTPIAVQVYPYTKYKREEMSVYLKSIYSYIINFIWLHVSTRNDSSSVHLNLLLWPNNYKWNVSSLRDPIRLYNGYTNKT
jgi:hypothetical protein